MTPNPDGRWMSKMARTLSIIFQEEMPDFRPTHIIRDRDAKFTDEFCSVLESDGIKFRPIPPPMPLDQFRLDDIVCHESLGGLLTNYERRAA
jgi:hypothetical protein